MLFYARTICSQLSPRTRLIGAPIQFAASISSLKVAWRKDGKLDQAIENDKRWRLCARVVKEVLSEPGQVIPLRYLEKRRERLRLLVRVTTFLAENPGLFDTYMDRIRPKSDPVRFLRPSNRLRQFLEEENRIYSRNESLLVSKLCKLLMMAKDRVVSADKLLEVKREFGFPNDFLVNSGIFYVSLKGGIKTAILREAYKDDDELIDRDPLLEIKDKFLEMLAEGHKQRSDQLRLQREMIHKDMEFIAASRT